MTNIISYIIGNKNFISDFHKTPIILNADNYFEYSIIDHNFPKKIKFESNNVEIIDLFPFINTRTEKISSNSKILVGEFNGELKGFLVDRVIEIADLSINRDQNSEFDFKADNEIKFIEIEELLGERA